MDGPSAFPVNGSPHTQQTGCGPTPISTRFAFAWTATKSIAGRPCWSCLTVATRGNGDAEKAQSTSRHRLPVLCRCTTVQVGPSRPPDVKIWVLATNLPQADFPAEVFGDLYHQRWRIEESYKRLKHRTKIESVSGLTQDAVLIDLYAKVLADNLNALVCMGSSENADLAPSNRHCNRAYAGACLQRILPRLVDRTGMSGCLAGESLWFARRKFTQAQTRSEISKTKSPHQTASEHCLQGVRLEFAALDVGRVDSDSQSNILIINPLFEQPVKQEKN